jgi:molecular chaperone GrpE
MSKEEIQKAAEKQKQRKEIKPEQKPIHEQAEAKHGEHREKHAAESGQAEQPVTEEQKKDPKDLLIEELTDILKRVQADFENYKKRVEKEKKQFMEFANKELLNELLPVLDSFHLALAHACNPVEFAKGMELVYSQLFSIIESSGVKKIEALGKKFDPYLHEVLLQEESDKEEGTIIEELQPGYIMHDVVLRHAKVKIAKKKK